MTSPNPMVGAVLAQGRGIIGQGWHHQAGGPHAEIEALRDAERRGCSAKRATLFVTLEPCCTHGRTPPCTEAIIAAGIKRVVAAMPDPNPKHRGKGFRILERAGVKVEAWGETAPRGERARVAGDCLRLNEAFNHWIAHRTPFVTVKAAMTLDGKIATASGESKWITGGASRARAMRMREGAECTGCTMCAVMCPDTAIEVYRSVADKPRQEETPA